MKTSLPVLLAAVLLSGCAIAQPLEEGPAAGDAPPDGLYVVGVTHFRLPRDNDVQKDFYDHVDVLSAKAREAPGNVGLSLRREIAGRDAWTMSIWLDMRSMGEFVASPEHLNAMVEIMPRGGEGWTVTYRLPEDQYPPAWDDALAELEDRGVKR